MIRIAGLAAVAALLLSAPSQATAGWGCYGVGCGYPGGWGCGPNYSTHFVPAPPYFAVHPPVYYSPHITARHYGASPYAWYPGMSPITYLPRRAAMIIKNPNAVQAKPDDEQKVAATIQAKPLMVENPFARADGLLAGTKLVPATLD